MDEVTYNILFFVAAADGQHAVLGPRVVEVGSVKGPEARLIESAVPEKRFDERRCGCHGDGIEGLSEDSIGSDEAPGALVGGELGLLKTAIRG